MADKTSKSFNHEERSILSITLDEAVDATCDIKADEDIFKPGQPAHDSCLEKDMDAAQRGSMMVKRKETDKSSLQPQLKEQYIMPGTGKKRTACGWRAKSWAIGRVTSCATITRSIISGWKSKRNSLISKQTRLFREMRISIFSKSIH